MLQNIEVRIRKTKGGREKIGKNKQMKERQKKFVRGGQVYS